MLPLGDSKQSHPGCPTINIRSPSSALPHLCVGRTSRQSQRHARSRLVLVYMFPNEQSESLAYSCTSRAQAGGGSSVTFGIWLRQPVLSITLKRDYRNSGSLFSRDGGGAD